MELFTNLALYIVLSLGTGYLLRTVQDEEGNPRLKWYVGGLIIGILCGIVNAVLVGGGLLFGNGFNLEVVAGGTAWQGGVNPQQWAATIYPGPKENFVFNASTIFWAQGLSSPPGHTLPWSHWSRPHGPDERVQRITHNLLQRALHEGDEDSTNR